MSRLSTEFKSCELLHFDGSGTTYRRMRPLVHPPADEICLQGLLHALADPVRLDLFRRLCRDQAAAVSCVRCAPVEMPRSSLSRHVQILREAGLIRSARRGAELINIARNDEIETRFPGLLSAILSAAQRKADPCRIAEPHRINEAGVRAGPERMKS